MLFKLSDKCSLNTNTVCNLVGEQVAGAYTQIVINKFVI